MKAITYSRVSTSHHEQKPEAQVEELRRYCTARGWTVTEEIVDHGFSGGSDQRPGLKHLVVLVRARKVDVVVVTRLDRLARSLKHLVTLLDEFQSLGVLFVSVGDQIDLGTASGRLMLHIVAAFAEFERALIRERTVAGLIHARRKGKVVGRPKLRNDNQIQAMREKGASYRAICRQLGCSMGAVVRALSTAPKSPSRGPANSSKDSRGRHG